MCGKGLHYRCCRKASWAAHALILASALALLPACGGGGDHDGDGTPQPSVTGTGSAPATGPGDVEKFFPASVGNQWFFTYDATEYGVTSAGLSTVSVTGTRSIGGTPATVLAREDADPDVGTLEDYYGISPGGITYLGNNDAEDTITPMLLPWVQLLFPVNVGTMSTVTGTNLPFGTDGSGNPVTLDVTQRIQNAAFEPISVPAGNFARALRQVTQLEATARIARLNQSVDVSGTETTWVVPGVGVVKTTSTATVDVETSSSAAELRGYVIDGVKFGYGLPFTLIPDLSPVFSGDPNPPYGLPAIATDGEHFLVVSRRITGQSPEYYAHWIASLVALDGTMISSVDLGPPRRMYDPSAAQQATVAFDGTNYLIVTEQDNNFASTANYMSLVATRVSAAGALLGALTEVAPPGSNSPMLAFDGARYLLVYRSSILYDSFGPIAAVFIAPATGQTAGGVFQVTAGAGYQTRPDVAFDGTNYLVVWEQASFNDQPPGVFAARISRAGSVLDPTGMLIHPSTLSGYARRPAVGFDGSNYLVVWEDNRQLQNDGLHNNVYAMRVTPGGQFLDGDASTGGFPLTTGSEFGEVSLRLAFFDDHYLVVWVASSSPGVYEGLRGARVTSAGTVVSPGVSGIPLTNPRGHQFGPAIAATQAGALLTWRNPFATEEAGASNGGLSIYPFGD